MKKYLLLNLDKIQTRAIGSKYLMISIKLKNISKAIIETGLFKNKLKDHYLFKKESLTLEFSD